MEEGPSAEKAPPAAEIKPEESLELTPTELADLGDAEEVLTRPVVPAPPEGMPRFRYRKKTQAPILSPFMIPAPVDDPGRSDKVIRVELEARKTVFNPLNNLQNIIEGMAEGRKRAADALRAQQATFFLKNVLYPYIDSVANEFGTSAADHIRTMVRNGESLGDLMARTPQDQINATLRTPQSSLWMRMIKPFLEGTEAMEMRDPIIVDWWIGLIRETRTDLYQVIHREVNGRWWITESLVDILNFIRGNT